MEVLAPIVGMAMQLAFFGLIAWAIIRLLGRRRDTGDEVDRATSVRRLITHGLLLVTLMLSAIGITVVGRTVLTPAWSDEERTALALGLAFTLVAGPAFVLLLWFARSRLRDDPGERTSLSWAAYLNTVLATSLVVSILTIHQLLEGVIGVDELEWRGTVAPVVWPVVWAMHWFWLRRVHGLPADLHDAIGSLAGLVTMVIGLGGLVYVAGDEIYTSVVDRLPAGHAVPEVGTWLLAAAIGGVVWAGHWLLRYRRAARTSLWHVYVVLIGALGGLVTAIAAGTTIAAWVTVWYLGTPADGLPSEHFEGVPVAASFLLVGGAVWQYHRTVLHRGGGVDRSEPLRAYDYLMAASGLGTAVAGATLALDALFEWIAPDTAGDGSGVINRVILAAILGVIGVPLWSIHWARIRRHLDADPAAEIGSLTRRVYVVLLFGIGGITALISLIVVVFVGIDDLLNRTFGTETLASARVGLALLATVTGVAWYHLHVFRSDRTLAERLAPPPTPLPPPAPLTPPATHVVLITPRDGELAALLAAATGAVVETWVREDDLPMPAIDVDELVARILDDAGHEVAVVVGPTGAEVIPYGT